MATGVTSISETTAHDGKPSWVGNVFSIPPGNDFLGSLVNALMCGELIAGYNPQSDPLPLSEATIYVPNRRAARGLSTSFLGWFEGRSTLLPTIRTLGDTDDLDFGLTDMSGDTLLHHRPIGDLDRKLELARLIQSWKTVIAAETRKLLGDEEILIPTSTPDSILLAEDLASLLTQITQEEIEWDRVHDLVPEDHAEWWRLTSTFLKIIMENWPDHLKECGLLDPAEHAIELLKLRARQYSELGSKGPVIVAGSTGSVPSTRLLLRAVAGLPNGAVVLPGVDFNMPEAEWKRLSAPNLQEDPLVESHPQFGLAQTLGVLGSNRENVTQLGHSEPAIATRNSLVGIALSLSDFSAEWNERIRATDKLEIRTAFAALTLIEAVNERQEALAIAIALRETLETENGTAAMVTPDRNLARRVSMELERFGIRVDDSSGVPLQSSSAAVFVRLLVLLCFDKPSNSELASLMKHPLLSRFYEFRLGAFFELICLRGVIHSPQPGKFADFIKLRRTQIADGQFVSPVFANIDEASWEELINQAARFDGIVLPVVEFAQQNETIRLGEAIALVKQMLIALSFKEDQSTKINEAVGGRELDQLFEQILQGSAAQFEFQTNEFPKVLDALFAGITCRSGNNSHSRLHIYGPLEVRLLDYDRVVLSGLNEDTWPQNHRSDPFLNRSLRRQLNMPSPERRTGLAAHDFQQLMGKGEVILSRSGRVDKAPTVASRWLQRLLALVGEDVSEDIRRRGSTYIDYAIALDDASEKQERAKRPDEHPPLELRPKMLPVTDVETWIRDPYALYAKRILKFRVLDPLEREPDALLKGTLYHAIMEAYVASGGPEVDATERVEFLNEIASRHIKAENLPKDLETIWKARFEEIATSFIEWELDYQEKAGAYKSHCEVSGKTPIDDNFTLTARADRLDVLADGSVNVFDYKTGGSPSPEQARTLSPQLALEALIAQRAGFETISVTQVTDMRYLRLRPGSGKPIGKENIATKDEPLETIIQNASENLKELVAAYASAEQGYASRVAPFKDSEMSGDYDHLARVREWSFGEDDGDE